MSQRESERKSESGKGKGKRKRKGKGKRERASTKAWAIIFLNRPGQSEKSANYTVMYMEEQYSM
jgi:hypothetical protein